MKIPTDVQAGLVLVAASAFWAAIAWAEPWARPLVEAQRATVESLEKQMPIGLLGVPLGTVVRVTGEVFDGDETRCKADAGKTFLRVATVNGGKLAEPVVFEFLRAPAAVKKPTAGTSFDYYVHEYGAFDGVVEPPKELGIETPEIAHDGFYYRRALTVHASNPVLE
jgi:hypothetical protein